MIIRYFYPVFLIIALLSCKDHTDKKNQVARPGKNEMADLNRYFVEKDREKIQNYTERKNLDMKESPTGLWYQIINEGKGNFISDNDKVFLDYECSLLDGKKIYSSNTLGPKELVLGRSLMEAGLNEGLRMLKPGGEAIFIIPSYLAYGLLGDRKLIPSRAIIVYRVKVNLSVNNSIPPG
jgi:FKBP-type peptidyl-prolyl cis-trans isomerase